MSGLPQRRMRRCEPGDHDRLARADHDPPCGAAHARLRPKRAAYSTNLNRWTRDRAVVARSVSPAAARVELESAASQLPNAVERGYAALPWQSRPRPCRRRVAVL